ncbi:MAG: neutral/alkaline non-lysosomal ceramidase N-terminal domain-containing protein, partial [Planctomycetes bacterium]|nr:neutral/alkaline non-lysosomal ceramidase N-terminal domain-containing protein [Planctomycetota bacterium]
IATADITPPVGATMVGYKPRKSTAQGHTLRAEALVCKDSAGRGWALITSDTIGYPRAYVQDVRRLVAARTSLAAEAVIVSGTHTHSGPATSMFGDEELEPLDVEYLESLKETLADLVARAWAAAAPATLEVAYTEAPALGSNRRIQQADGTWANEWNDPDGKHPGYFDPTVMLVGVRRPDKHLAALVVAYGCHPVVLGPDSFDISADYPGYMKDTLEAQRVAETVLFVNPGGANINPRVCIRVGAELPKTMGEALAAIVAPAVGKLSPIASGEPRSHLQPWNIVRTRDALKGQQSPGRRKGDTIASEIQAFRAGDLSLVSLPGELFSEYQSMLREASPTEHTLPVSLANDYIGYFPTDEAQAQGAYEANMAPAAGLEGMLMDHAHKAFAAIAD